MYEQYYGLNERPFSITPDPRFVYLSQRHQDALAHLLYGIGRGGSGGFVQLTGEVGTGKTTLCRLLLEQVPEDTRIALILNPLLEPKELLRAICRELEVEHEDSDGGLDDLGERLNRYLLDMHAQGQRVVLMIDEAQNMSRETLEQVRLLTNLETATDKLLQIILLGQPELRELLSRASLRQLAQRITARYHLAPLNQLETAEYVRHRMAVAGQPRCPFTPKALRSLHHASAGVPRLINIIADRALMAGYSREADQIQPAMVRMAAAEVTSGGPPERKPWLRGALAGVAVLAFAAMGLSILLSLNSVEPQAEVQQQPVWRQAIELANADDAWREAAALWSDLTEADVRAACLQATTEGVVCQLQRGNLALIEKLDLPVILKLARPSDGQVLLVGVDQESMLLRQSGQSYRVPIRQAEEYWWGEFYVIWPDDGQVWRRGDSDAVIGQIKQLAAADSEQPWTGPMDAAYGEDFERWVRDFQRRKRLEVDGMLGPVTRLYLTAPTLDAVRLIDAES
ncbi:MAG: AAA family ATPase [Pseudomonadota bacterium]